MDDVLLGCQYHGEDDDTIMRGAQQPLSGGMAELVNMELSKIALVKPRSTPSAELAALSLSGERDTCCPNFTYTSWHDGTPLDVSAHGAFVQQERDRLKLKRSSNELGMPPLLRTVNAVSIGQSVAPSSLSYVGRPPPGAISFFDAFGAAACRSFTTSGPGRIYRPAALDLLHVLKWPAQSEPHADLVLNERGTLYQRLLPSFLQLLVQMKKSGRQYSLILHSSCKRKLEAAGRALDAFAQGKHPFFRETLNYIDLVELRCTGQMDYQLQMRSDSQETYKFRDDAQDGAGQGRTAENWNIEVKKASSHLETGVWSEESFSQVLPQIPVHLLSCSPHSDDDLDSNCRCCIRQNELWGFKTAARQQKELTPWPARETRTHFQVPARWPRASLFGSQSPRPTHIPSDSTGTPWERTEGVLTREGRFVHG